MQLMQKLNELAFSFHSSECVTKTYDNSQLKQQRHWLNLKLIYLQYLVFLFLDKKRELSHADMKIHINEMPKQAEKYEEMKRIGIFWGKDNARKFKIQRSLWLCWGSLSLRLRLGLSSLWLQNGHLGLWLYLDPSTLKLHWGPSYYEETIRTHRYKALMTQTCEREQCRSNVSKRWCKKI